MYILKSRFLIQQEKHLVGKRFSGFQLKFNANFSRFYNVLMSNK